MKSTDVVLALHKKSNKTKAKLLMRFFKTGKGQYGEGDIFLGVMVPEQRIIALKFQDLSLEEVLKLLKSKFHECRLIALIILTLKFEKCRRPPSAECKKIYNKYIANTKYINNWDLVDLSAPRIVGRYLFDKDRDILYNFARSNNLWKKRIAIISTMYFINQNDFKDTIKISKILLSDKHDLIHKAVGWMLREVGKRNEKTLTNFLDKHTNEMSRTTLRYAIERFPESKRQKYLNKI